MLWPQPVVAKRHSGRYAETAYHKASAALERGELDAALSHANIARQLLDDSPDQAQSRQAEVLMGDILVALGQTELACAHYQRALVGCDGAEEAVLWTKLADAWRSIGQVDRAIRSYEKARQGYKRLQQLGLGLHVTYQIAYLHYEQGRWREAECYYRKALRLDDKSDSHLLRSRILLELGNTLAHQGRLDEARALFAQSAACAGTQDDRSVLASALHGLGVTHAYSGQHSRAHTFYHHSLALKTQAGDRVSAATTLYELGISAAAQGERGQAIELLQQAVAWYTSVAAPEAEVARVGLAQLLGAAHHPTLEKTHLV
jgi:tetratricopeptide (TPR) repeat protein